MIQLLQEISDEVNGVLEQVKEQELKEVMEKIRKDRRIFVDGEGRSGFSAKGFAMRLMHLGYTVYFVGETITPAVSKGDVFIAVSGSGKSKNVINDAESAKQKGCILITVTSKTESPLSDMADVRLVIPGTVKADSGDKRASIQLLSSLFDQSLHIVLDMLCLMLSRRDNMSNEEATKIHW